MSEDDTAIIGFLKIIPDPRVERCKKYTLESILFIVLTGMLCGAESFIEIVDVADANIDWLKKYVSLANGIPSHDTICRVFSLIEKDNFVNVLLNGLNLYKNKNAMMLLQLMGKAFVEHMERV